METTRHFTATVYIVNNGATALHHHERLGICIPPGGHVERDELPHQTAVRECEEETGLTPAIVSEATGVETPVGRPLPRPRHQMLYDINVHDGEVGHQHIDQIFYASVPERTIDPADGERSAAAWDWYAPAELRAADLDEDVVEIGIDAIETVRQ